MNNIEEINMRIWHKDLIPVLPDDLLIQLYEDCARMLDNLRDYNSTGDDLCDRVLQYPKSHFYTYCIYYVKLELTRRDNIWADLSEFDILNVEYWASDYNELITSNVSHEELFEFWHSTRYLQQCILFLEEMFDCDLIQYSDWFRIVNSVKNSSALCNETYECLFL